MLSGYVLSTSTSVRVAQFRAVSWADSVLYCDEDTVLPVSVVVLMLFPQCSILRRELGYQLL